MEQAICKVRQPVVGCYKLTKETARAYRWLRKQSYNFLRLNPQYGQPGFPDLLRKTLEADNARYDQWLRSKAGSGDAEKDLPVKWNMQFIDCITIANLWSHNIPLNKPDAERRALGYIIHDYNTESRSSQGVLI